MSTPRRGTAKPPGKLRIIGGDFRRRMLPVLDHPGLRPTPDRVRETLFNWLGQALHMKQTISAHVAGQKITGKCIELLDDGGLVLLDESGTSHHITTGDVELIGR